MKIIAEGGTGTIHEPWFGDWVCQECAWTVLLETGDALTDISDPMYDGISGRWPAYHPIERLFAWHQPVAERITPVRCKGCHRDTTYWRLGNR